MNECGELEVIIDTCNLNVNISASVELDCHAVVHFEDKCCSQIAQYDNYNE